MTWKAAAAVAVLLSAGSAACWDSTTPQVPDGAAGSAIVSDFLAGTTASLSGTSMASPHVAGVGVLYKATFGDAPSATVSNWIISNSTTGLITGNPGGTPNRLLSKGNL